MNISNKVDKKVRSAKGSKGDKNVEIIYISVTHLKSYSLDHGLFHYV